MPTFCTAGSMGSRLFSMETSHDQMHDYLQCIMNNAVYSLSNLVFFLYHSWIDLELEIKTRMIRSDPVES